MRRALRTGRAASVMEWIPSVEWDLKNDGRDMRGRIRRRETWRAARCKSKWNTCACPHRLFSRNKCLTANSRLSGVIRQHVGDAGTDLLRGRHVEEFVRAVRVGMWAQHARHHELRLGIALAQHRHERDRAAFAHEGDGPAEMRGRG